MGRVVLVTGAASGIGLGVAQWFARDGHRVAMLDRTHEAVAAASADLNAQGYETLPFAVDVSDREQVQAAIEQTREKFGPVEVAILCAGISEYVPFLDITQPVWDRMIDVNLTGMFHCLQLVIPDMVAANWGRIVTISSLSAQIGGPNMVHYSASKGGVSAMTKAIAREFADKGITANSIPPSIIQTGMSKRGEDEQGRNPRIDAMVAMVPVKRIGLPEDIAAACAWLCSDDAGFVTGQDINVNGGMHS